MLRRTVLLSSALLALPSLCLAKQRKLTSKETEAIFDISIASIILSGNLFDRDELDEKIKEMKSALPNVKDKELKTETRKLIAKAQTLLRSTYVSRAQMREMNEQANLVKELCQEVLDRK